MGNGNTGVVTSWIPSRRWLLLTTLVALLGCGGYVTLRTDGNAGHAAVLCSVAVPPPPSDVPRPPPAAVAAVGLSVRMEPPPLTPVPSAPPPTQSEIPTTATATTATVELTLTATVAPATTTIPPSPSHPSPSSHDLTNCTMENGAPLSTPCNGDFDEVCVGGLKCPQHCMAVDGLYCLHNPYWPNDATTKYDETVCVNRAPASPKPSLPPQPLATATNDNSTTTATATTEVVDPVLAFKSRTAWAFDQWWDWEATCVPPRSEENARYRAYVDAASKEYVLENVCVQGVGHLAGFNGTVSENFDARDEVEYEIPAMRDFVNTIDALPTPPACFVDDVDLILSFQDVRVSNVAHAFHRFAQIRMMQRLHFPQPGDPPHLDVNHTAAAAAPRRSKTLVGHVWLHDLFGPEQGNALRYFLPMMGDAWFSVFGSEAYAQSNEALRRVGGQEGLWRLGNTSLCFRRARIAHACIVPHCSGTRIETRAEEQFRDAPGRRFKLSYVTPRTAYDAFILGWIRQAVARCVGVIPKESAETVNPAVVFAVRSRNRRFRQSAAHALPIVQYMQRKHHAASVLYSDVMTLKPNTLLRMHINLDVLIGAFGSGLVWVALMPRGASLVEVCGADWGCPAEGRRNGGGDGFFSPAECEYAGYAAARGARQFHHAIPAPENGVYVVTPSRWQFIIDTAFCALRWEPQTVFALNASTPTMTTSVLRYGYQGLIRDCERIFDNSTNTSWSDVSA